jgi:O-antigen/teichoic acid export membrane protein
MYQRIIEIWRSLLVRNSFVQNSAWMFASSGISILIQFVFFYILSRIYSPEVYGLFAIFNFYIGIVGNAVSLGYNQAFVLPKKDLEFSALLRLTIWVTLFTSSIFFVIALLFGKSIMHLFGHDALGNWVYWIAPVSLVMGLDRITTDWAIRNKEFRGQTLWSTTTTLGAKIFNTLYGMKISPTAAGLVFTTGLQYLSRMIAFCLFILKDFKVQFAKRFSWDELKSVARSYKEFPLYIYWGNLINILSNNLPAALLTPLGYSLGEVGYYSYSLIVLDLPIRLLGAGVSSVYMQKAADLAHNRMEDLVKQTWRLYKNMVFVCLLFSAIIIAAGEPLYLLLLENEWAEAGRVAEVLIIFYFFRMISSPLSSLFSVLRKENQFFVFHIALTAVRILSLATGAWFKLNFLELMWTYSIANALMYFIFCVWIFRLIHYPMMKVIVFTLVTSLSAFALAYVIKFALLN